MQGKLFLSGAIKLNIVCVCGASATYGQTRGVQPPKGTGSFIFSWKLCGEIVLGPYFEFK